MRTVIATLVLLAMCALAYAGPAERFIDVQHDDHRGVTCWILPGTGISCLPDSQLRNTAGQAGEQCHDRDTPVVERLQNRPTPTSMSVPRRHEEKLQL